MYEGNHEITIYGWNKNGFLFANSWGINWADSGTCTIPYTYGYDEAWATIDDINITVTPVNPIVVVTPTNKGLMDIIYKIGNFFINNFCSLKNILVNTFKTLFAKKATA
jgi:hypothetical protein